MSPILMFGASYLDCVKHHTPLSLANLEMDHWVSSQGLYVDEMRERVAIYH